MLFFSLVTFISSFLLFLVQPLVGKILLPDFGGVSSVWTTIMMFFMMILLVGYIYVVWLSKQAKRKQLFLHAIIVFVVALVTFTIFIKKNSFFSLAQIHIDNNFPVLTLVIILTQVLALPCFLLATTSTLLQSWYSKIFPNKSPFSIYIFSNLGSLLGLLSYHYLVSPYYSLNQQQFLWISGFVLYILLIYLAIFFSSGRIKKTKEAAQIVGKIKKSVFFIWFILPFISTTVMLTLTTYLTLSISPIPFVWIATLSIYLLSFILAFIEGDWYPREFYTLFMLFLVIVLSIFSSGFLDLKYSFYLPFSLFALLIINLVLHRELFMSKPRKENLTYFYLAIALGGIAASIFTGIIAPIIFTEIIEYPLILIAVTITGIVILFKNPSSTFRLHTSIFGVVTVLLTAWLFIFSWKWTYESDNLKIISSMRNFYGIVHVLKSGNKAPYLLEIMNGNIEHGNQEIGGSQEDIPTTYFAKDSGLGIAILNHANSLKKLPLRIGVIGLGAGTTAAYCNRNSYIRFYEINPQVIDVARRYFTYLKNAENRGCKVDIIEGDARLSLTKELILGEKGKFDILAVDAFTDDSIPIHLLTAEAIKLYLFHLNVDGIIAFNVTNKSLNLWLELQTLAEKDGLYFNRITSNYSEWVLLSRYSTGSESYIPKNSIVKEWTDNYSNILQILKN